jgi:hypothetical protein
MALTSFALQHSTPTISFNPYRAPTKHPWEGGTSPQTQAQLESLDDFNKRIGLGVGLSAFLISVIALFAYAGYRRRQRHRQTQQVLSQRMEQRHITPRVLEEPQRPTVSREMESMVAETRDDVDPRPKQPSTHVHVHGPERGESSSSGGVIQQTFQSIIPPGGEHQGRSGISRDFEQQERYINQER